MNAGQRSARRIAARPFTRDSICTSCLLRIEQIPSSRRHAATAAAEAPSTQSAPVPPVTATRPTKSHALMASPVVIRPPLLTRELTPFEKSYYLYQKRLNERTAYPFMRYFYYRQGTPADPEWKRKMKGRKSAARDIGQYSGYGAEAWNDEVLVGDKTAEWDSAVEALIRDAEGKTISDDVGINESKEGEVVSGDAAHMENTVKDLTKVAVSKPLPRTTQADEQNDTRSLSRKLDRALYLLVKNKDGKWRFPEDRVAGRENLHQAAERVMIQACGINMNTWIVGNHPIGHHSITYADKDNNIVGKKVKVPANALVSTSKELEREEFGQKVFFMKVRIMAGQVDLKKNEFGDQDFQWLTKEELQGVVHPRYWNSIRNMLTER